VAATAEKIVEESVMRLLDMLRKTTKADKIVFSGGLFQNVALNGSLVKSDFKDFYFPSAPSDAGLSLGAALWVKNKSKKNRQSEPVSAFLGPSFSRGDVEKVFKSFNLNYIDKLKNIEESVAEMISTGKTVGWFSGRAEYGPRSLGARSLLADPRSGGSKARINQLLKKRDWFMPYAPSILEEDLQDWVESPVYSPYMQIALKIRKDKKGLIPAAVHVDGTSRVHVVRRSDNEQYWRLISAFKEITGIPIVLNTSFNRHGIATISTPRHAVYHLLEGCMDALAVEGFLARLDDNRNIVTSVTGIVCEDMQKKLMAIERLEVFKRLGDFDTFTRYLARVVDFLEVEYLNDAKVSIKEGDYVNAIDCLISELSHALIKSEKGRDTL
jgi:carbamoyltransferase